MLIDLDRFKTINDTLGHMAGDHLLREAAQRLKSCVRATDTVARLGGDEFIVVLPDVDNAFELTGIANRVLAAMSESVTLEGRDLVVSASIGIAMYPDDSKDAEELIRFADGALYRAKETGRNKVKFYTRDITERDVERLHLEADLRRGLARGELEVHYQPKIELATGDIVGAEALLRWRHPDRGWVPPADFISIAEDTGLIVSIGENAVRDACRTACEWNKGRSEQLHIAVNLSPRQFHMSDVPKMVREALFDTGCKSQWLELEITEGLLLADHDATRAALDTLSEMGVSIAIDDFGTGYSALSYLTQFPIATLKVDRSFTQSAICSARNLVLLESIVALAHGVGLKVVAEGIENQELADWLASVGCDMGQGYLWEKAIPARALLGLRTRSGTNGINVALSQ